MSPGRSRGAIRAGIGILVVVALSTGIVGLAAGSPARLGSLLRDRAGAQWIVYPHVPRTGIRPGVGLTTTFSREFHVGTVQRPVKLRALGLDEIVRVRINGVLTPPESDDVASLLHAGANTIDVEVVNAAGPPALWLRLRGDGLALVSEAGWTSSWAGAVEAPARRASDPVDPAEVDPDLRAVPPWAAFRVRVLHDRWLGGLAVVTLLCTVAAVSRGRRAERVSRGAAIGVGVALLVVAWVVLAWNDAGSLSALDGYDAAGHLEYVEHVRAGRGLPEASDGWSMFQPPLYYLAAGALLAVRGVPAFGDAAFDTLHAFGTVLGAIQVVLVFLCLRAWMPGRGVAQLLGTGVAALLPVQLRMFQFVGNDALAATLATASLAWALRMLDRDRRERPHDPFVLGALLGGALLAKLTALVVVGSVLAVLILRSLGGAERPWRARLARPLWTVLVVLATSAWHYGRVAARYGTPLAGNWDASVLPAWWQDPGFTTLGYMTRFGEALRHPAFASFSGWPAGLYSTLWGDGLLSGASRAAVAPPWGAERMAAGYVLAIVPSLLAVAGAVIWCVRACRRREAGDLLAITIAAGTVAALAVWPFRVPIYSVVKAAFGMPAIAVLALFVAVGWDAIVRAAKWSAVPLAVALVLWGANAYATHWIPRGSGSAQGRLAWIAALRGGPVAEIEARAQRALARAPADERATVALARARSRSGRMDEAEALLRTQVERDPEAVRPRLELARLLAAVGRENEAAARFREIVALRPFDPESRLALAHGDAARGRWEDAERHLRDALRTAPELASIHRLLSDVLRARGDVEGADDHRRWAEFLEVSAPGR